MLILCTGPDTFRAQRKAQELEAAFKTKYDPSGSSIERLSSGKDAVGELVERANTTSLFSPRRFLRTSGLLENCPAAKLSLLSKILVQDPENVIVVSVEEEIPADKILKAIGEVKIIKYSFAEETGKKFLEAVQHMAKEINVKDQTLIGLLAAATEGDSWRAWNELQKMAASGQLDVVAVEAERSVFDHADAYLMNRLDRYASLKNKDGSSPLLHALLNATRSYIRVRDGEVDGLHPYVVRKLKSIKSLAPENILARSIGALMASRSSYGTDDEVIASV